MISTRLHLSNIDHKVDDRSKYLILYYVYPQFTAIQQIPKFNLILNLLHNMSTKFGIVVLVLCAFLLYDEYSTYMCD